VCCWCSNGIIQPVTAWHKNGMPSTDTGSYRTTKTEAKTFYTRITAFACCSCSNTTTAKTARQGGIRKLE